MKPVDLDLIYHILVFLSPCEIVRLRQVSKEFRDMTHSHALWKTVYTNARLPRPPGTFYWQSARYLESTLVQSELVSNTWTSQPPKTLSLTITSWQEEEPIWTTIFGRWCIFLDGNKIKCHDIDSDTYHSIYDGTAHPDFHFTTNMAGTADINGHRMYLLLLHANYDLGKLLAFHVNDDGFSEPEITSLTHVGSQTSDPWLSTDGVNNSTPFITIQRYNPCLVLDLRTRCLYRLPISELHDDLMSQSPILADAWYNNVILTKTHVIAVWLYANGPSIRVNATVLIQAFVIPDSATLHGVGELRLTHETILDTYLCSSGLLRNSIVDPVTGSVNIRLLLHVTTVEPSAEQKHMICFDLTLPKPSTDILPISTRSQHLFESSWGCERHTASDDGYARGVLLLEQEFPYLGFNSFRKFSIDASEEECAIEISDPYPLDTPIWSRDIVFDGTRGRIHYIQGEDDENEVVTIDLA